MLCRMSWKKSWQNRVGQGSPLRQTPSKLLYYAFTLAVRDFDVDPGLPPHHGSP
jgi:hypothetical protein